LEKSLKLKMTNTGEAVAFTSFDVTIPRVFANSINRVVSPKDSHFDQIKTWKDWSDSSTGFKKRLERALKNFRAYQQESINQMYLRASPFHNLASMALNETISFAEGFIYYIDKTYKEYTDSRFGPEKAWHITTLLASKLVEHIAEPRRGLRSSTKLGDQDQFNVVITMATLRSLDRMEYIRNLDYENVPEVASELVKFISKNTALEAVDSLKAGLAEQQTGSKDLAKKIRGIETSLSTLGNKVDDMVKRVKALEAKK
jgi:hypothetical protein